MKAISLWQPWATLVIIGAKQRETRSWSTSYRGPLAIHATKLFPALGRLLCADDPFHSALLDAGYGGIDDLPLGCILGTVDLVDCTSALACYRSLSSSERAFGDYGRDRYAWVLENVVRFPEPIPVRGKQGLWEWTS